MATTKIDVQRQQGDQQSHESIHTYLHTLTHTRHIPFSPVQSIIGRQGKRKREEKLFYFCFVLERYYLDGVVNSLDSFASLSLAWCSHRRPNLSPRVFTFRIIRFSLYYLPVFRLVLALPCRCCFLFLYGRLLSRFLIACLLSCPSFFRSTRFSSLISFSSFSLRYTPDWLLPL